MWKVVKYIGLCNFLFQLFFNSTVRNVLIARYFLDSIFILNIISRFWIGYESHGIVITDPSRVRWTYLRTWFVMDLLSVLPLETLRYTYPQLHFMHFNRCLRVFRLFDIISSFSNEPDTNKIYVQLLKSSSIIALCVQISACIWFNQVCEAAYDGHPRHCRKAQNWLNLVPEFSTNLTGTTDLKYYTMALYWSIITLTNVGYGELHAMNEDEVVVASIVMVIGLIAFNGVIMADLSSIISNLDRRRGRFCHRMETICLYMKSMELPEEVQTWVQKYYHYLWIYQKGRNVEGLFDDLPFALHSNVSSARYNTLMKKCKLIKGTDDGFQSALSLKFKTQTFNPGQILARPGEINQNLYYIEHGLVQVFEEDQNETIATLLPGSLIGEVFLMYKIPRNATVCAATLCEICILERNDLLTLFADYPEAGVKIVKAAKTRLHSVKHSIREAFALGVASTPHDVVFHKDMSVSLNVRDQRFFTSFMEVSAKKKAHTKTNEQKCFWQKTISPDRFYREGWGAFYLALCCVADLVAATDILVTLRTEVVTKDGYLSDFSELFKHYRTSWNFYYDVLSVFPFDLIAFSEDGTDHWIMLGYIRWNRILWLRKIYVYFTNKENDMEHNSFNQRIAKCIFLLIFSVHFCSGLVYVSACDTFRCDENSWAWHIGLKANKSNFYHYMYAAYFATTTMTSTGYGDIVPNSMKERIASTVVAFIGLFVFNYIISQIYATLGSKDANRATFQNLLLAIRLFMKQHDLSESLQQRVIEYMSLLWTKYQGEAHPRGPFLMNNLPVELKQTVLINERGKLLSQIPYFEQAGKTFIGDLCSSSVIYYFPRGEIIQYSGTITRELFCIRRGTCQVLTDDLSEIVGVYEEGMYFGEAGFLFGKQALMTVHAKTYCEIVVIEFEKVQTILERYPVIKRNAILPSDGFYIKWEIVRIIVAVAVSLISSLLCAFLHYKTELWIVSYVLLFACWIDIYIRLHVAFYKGNLLKLDTLETARHYVHTGFLLDFISCFPWEVLCLMLPHLQSGFYGNNEILHLYACMRIPHVFQLYRIPLAYSFWQSGISTEKAILTFLRFVLYSILFLHFTTCIIFAAVCPVADMYGDTTKYFFPVVKHNCTELSWVTHLDYTSAINASTATFFELYSLSLYFATVTLCGTGFGDIHPYLTHMKILMIFIMIVGTLYSGWLSGSSAAVLANADVLRTDFTEKTQSMKLFLKRNKITGSLYSSTLHFYAFKWIRTKGIDDDTIFKYLPSSLSGDISTILYADVIATQPIFQTALKKDSIDRLETDCGFIRMLARHIRPCLYRANDVICKKGTFGSEMYFIDKGEVDVLSQNELDVVVKLRDGQYFGEDSLLFAEPRNTTIRAATNCDLFVLSKKSLDETIKYFPDICEQMRRASAMKKDQFHQGKDQRLKGTRSESAEDLLLRDTGYLKIYRDAMAEDERKQKRKALPLWIRLLHLLIRVLDKVMTIHNTTVSPDNTIRVVYQYTSCLLIIISFWAITYMIILKFHICYYDESGSYISNYKLVSRNFMTRKVGYVFDVICSFPYAWTVLHQMYEMPPMMFLPLLAYARTGHLFRIATALVFMWNEEQLITSNLMVIRIIKTTVNTILLIHCIAMSFVAFVIHFGNQSWLSEFDIYFFPEVYRYAVYWALATYTTTGYGDIKPITFREVIFAIFIMILLKIHVNYNMGRISSTQTNNQSAQVAFEEKLQTIQAYMVDHNIPSSLQNQVIRFYNYRWTHAKGIDSETLFKDLPHCMKAEIFSRISIDHLKKHQLFRHLTRVFLWHLSSKMILKGYVPGQYINRKGDKGSGMHLILLGTVKVCSYRSGKEVIEYHSAGTSLGVHLLLKQGLCRDTVIAKNYVDVFFLSRAAFDEIGSYYPQVRKKLMKRSSAIVGL
ncbi:cyclic nucleotide-gated cation channel alpha-3-like [Salminus brasiliensis]|uniref:cyclic nucleotide-gated cation channel alpha-3-like n=1 Tax=Salminus brasiliensis TaxID=930266 RepID=UPI003B82F665